MGIWGSGKEDEGTENKGQLSDVEKAKKLEELRAKLQRAVEQGTEESNYGAASQDPPNVKVDDGDLKDSKDGPSSVRGGDGEVKNSEDEVELEQADDVMLRRFLRAYEVSATSSPNCLLTHCTNAEPYNHDSVRAV